MGRGDEDFVDATRRVGNRKKKWKTKKEPPWFVRDVVVVLAIGLLLATMQIWVDNRRSDREERLENLRFVRDRSSSTSLDRPFSGIDLTGMNLSGLSLPAADFNGAKLDRARMALANFEDASFEDAHVRDADLREANLSGVHFDSTVAEGTNFGRATLHGARLTDSSFANAVLGGASISQVDFSGSSFARAEFAGSRLTEVQLVRADLSAAQNLQSAIFERVCHDESTRWPKDFSPPPSSETVCSKWSTSSWRETPFG